LIQVMAEVKLKQNREIEEGNEDQNIQHIENPWTSLIKPVVASRSSSSVAENKTVRWSEVEVASRVLEVTAENGYPIDLTESDDRMKAGPAIQQHLQDWMSATESRRLWLCGPVRTEEFGEVSMAAAYMVLLSERIKVSVIAYRFRDDEFGLPEDQSAKIGMQWRRSTEMDRLTMMLYSMIRQLVWLLPEEIESKSEFTFDRFDHLDGSTASLLDALNLFQELLALMPQLLVCVLDGFELVDNDVDPDGTAIYLALFLEILREAEQQRVLKVLLSSAGPCRTLMEEEHIQLDEQVHMVRDEGGEIAEYWEVLEEVSLEI